MQAFKTQINPQSVEFRANADTMRALVDDLRTKVMDVAQGGGDAALEPRSDSPAVLQID